MCNRGATTEFSRSIIHKPREADLGVQTEGDFIPLSGAHESKKDLSADIAHSSQANNERIGLCGRRNPRYLG